MHFTAKLLKLLDYSSFSRNGCGCLFKFGIFNLNCKAEFISLFTASDTIKTYPKLKTYLRSQKFLKLNYVNIKAKIVIRRFRVKRKISGLQLCYQIIFRMKKYFCVQSKNIFNEKRFVI